MFRYLGCSGAIVAILTTVATAAGPRTSDILEALRAGQLAPALAALDKGAKLPDEGERLEIARLLGDLAARASARDREAALLHALRILKRPISSERQSQCDALLISTGKVLATVLRQRSPKPGSEAHANIVNALQAVRKAMKELGGTSSRDLLATDIDLLPYVLASRRFMEAELICKEALRCPIQPDESQTVRGYMGLALLGSGKEKKALPFLESYLAPAPADPDRVLRVVAKLPTAMTAERYRFLLPVITKQPPAGQAPSWKSCLEAFYTSLRRASRRREPLHSLLERNEIKRNLPTIWGNRTWDRGYRIWRPDNYVRTKIGSGKHGLRAVLPASWGWRKVNSPPADLRRWRNHPLCFQRKGGGALLVIYWFGPDLQYWYGTTPAMRGMTGKGARGQSRSGIASIVAEIAYGKDAKERKLRFRKARPLGFSPSVGRTIHRAWRLGKTLYDESFFSIGQVTIEVLLRVDDEALKLLEPELRWLYSNIKTF